MAKRLFRSLLLILSGCLLVLGVQTFFGGDDWHDFAAQPTGGVNVEVVPKISQQETEKHRQDGFESLASLSDIATLPTAFTQDQALVALAGRSSQSGIEQLISEAWQLADGNLQRSALLTLFARYTELAPRHAVASIARVPTRYTRDITYTVFHYLASMDIDAALDSALAQENRQFAQWAAEAIYYAMQYESKELLTDIERKMAPVADLTQLKLEIEVTNQVGSPREKLAAVLALPEIDNNFEYTWQITQEWAVHSPQESLEYALSLNEVWQQEMLLDGVFEVWLETEEGTQQALEAIAELSATERRRAYNSLFLVWAVRSPLEALAGLEQLQDTQIKEEMKGSITYLFANRYPLEALQWAVEGSSNDDLQRLFEVMPEVAKAHPEEAIDALQTFDETSTQSLIDTVMSSVASNDPEKALEIAERLPQEQQHQALSSIAYQWISQDPEAAFDWLVTQSDSIQQNLLPQASSQLAYRDPEKAIQLLGVLPNNLREDMISSIVDAKANLDPLQAAEWIQQFSGSPSYEQMVQTVSSSWAQSDPEAALGFAANQSGTANNRVVNNIINTWSYTDPASAASWLSNNGNEQQLSSGARQVARIWTSQNPQEAQQWAQSLRSQTARDNALSGLISSGNLETDTAIELMGSITNKRSRNSALTSFVAQRYFLDKEAVTELADNPNLTAEERRMISEIKKSLDEGTSPLLSPELLIDLHY